MDRQCQELPIVLNMLNVYPKQYIYIPGALETDVFLSANLEGNMLYICSGSLLFREPSLICTAHHG